jgi:hypothetical protein
MIAEPKPKESPHRFARLTVPEDYRKLDKLRPISVKLHMSVTFTVEDLAAATDAAVPYAMDGDTRLHAKLLPHPPPCASAINTSIASFAHWLRLHLDKGEYEGQRLLSLALIQHLQTPAGHLCRMCRDIGGSRFAEGEMALASETVMDRLRFEPATSNRLFRVATADFAASLLTAPLVQIYRARSSLKDRALDWLTEETQVVLSDKRDQEATSSVRSGEATTRRAI